VSALDGKQTEAAVAYEGVLSARLAADDPFTHALITLDAAAVLPGISFPKARWPVPALTWRNSEPRHFSRDFRRQMCAPEGGKRQLSQACTPAGQDARGPQRSPMFT
jgi:hypothetical protein